MKLRYPKLDFCDGHASIHMHMPILSICLFSDFLFYLGNEAPR